MRKLSVGVIKIGIYLLFSLTIIFGQTMNKQKDVKEIQNIIHQVAQKYASDKRTSIFNINSELHGNEVLLKGESNRRDLKIQLIQEIEKNGFMVQDSVRILPSDELGDKVYGVINLSVANMRIKPSYNEELVTQALLGTPVNVYKKNGAWYLIQTPDEYISWVFEDAMKLMNKTKCEEWIKSDKIIYTSAFGFSFSQPDKNSQTVSDLVQGDILKVTGEKNGFIKIEYPDHRIAYVPVNKCEYFRKFINNLEIKTENIIKTAKSFMGIPYLWGGTSIKGVDCSGFIKSVFYLNGILLPRDVSQQINVGEFVTDKIEFDKIQPADLLFFRSSEEDKKEKATHVGIYIGDGKFIHSSGFVKISELNRNKNVFDKNGHRFFVEARRILTSLDSNGVVLLKNSNAYFEAKK